MQSRTSTLLLFLAWDEGYTLMYVGDASKNAHYVSK
jgi:hypothetical protein